MKERRTCCSCDECNCGPNCKCSEMLCRCEASSVLNSLGISGGGTLAGVPSNSSSKPSCCGSKKKQKKKDEAAPNTVADATDKEKQQQKYDDGSNTSDAVDVFSPTKAAVNAMIVAKWRVEDIMDATKQKVKGLFEDSQHLEIDDFLGMARGLVRGHDHAQQLCDRMNAIGVKAVLDFVEDPSERSQREDDLRATNLSDAFVATAAATTDGHGGTRSLQTNGANKFEQVQTGALLRIQTSCLPTVQTNRRPGIRGHKQQKEIEQIH